MPGGRRPWRSLAASEPNSSMTTRAGNRSRISLGQLGVLVGVLGQRRPLAAAVALGEFVGQLLEGSRSGTRSRFMA